MAETSVPVTAEATRSSLPWSRILIGAALLVDHFNPATVPELMCRSLISVRWDGRLYDCDFNQMQELELGGRPRTIWDVEDLTALEDDEIATAAHCFGCTAGNGSSCGGALA
jgi:hypothetical protein